MTRGEARAWFAYDNQALGEEVFLATMYLDQLGGTMMGFSAGL
jgi:hypothetical protein